MASVTRPIPTAERKSVSVGELFVGAAVIAVVAVAEAALLLMHARSWTLVGTVVVASVFAVVAGVVLLRRRPRVTVAPVQLATMAGVGAIAFLFAAPGFPMGMAGWDPGIYTNHAFAIARTGDYDLADPVVADDHDLFAGRDGAARFPGTSESGRDDGRSVVGFYHLYPALLAPAADIAGERGVVNVNPVLAVLTALMLTLVGWRVFGPVAGVLVGALSATNTIQVWHARLPSSEVLTELLAVSALLAIVVAHDTRWRAAAGLAGVLTGLIFVARGDGFVILLLALGGLLLLAATGRFDARAWWFAGGFALVLPHALAQAYRFAEIYTDSQGIPGAPKLVGAMVVLAASAALAWRLRRGALGARVDSMVIRLRQPGLQRAAGVAFVAAFGLVVLVSYLRPLWMDDRPAQEVLGGSVPYYNARAMLRLTWYFTPLGIAALGVGIAVVALRRWSFPRWIVVLPSLAVMPVYLADARIAPRLIWWTRRFVPFALPGLLLLVAVGLAAALLWSGRGRRAVRAVGAIATVVVVGSWWTMSWPLRGHDELAGSFGVHHAVAEVAGDEPAVWLWSTEGTPPGYIASASAFASTMLYRRGDATAQLGDDAQRVVDAYRAAFPDLPVYVVADGHDPPDGLSRAALEEVQKVDVRLPLWELTYDRRPTKAVEMPFLLTVWHVVGS